MLCFNPPDQLPHYYASQNVAIYLYFFLYASQNEAIYFSNHPMETHRLLLSNMKYEERNALNTAMFGLVDR